MNKFNLTFRGRFLPDQDRERAKVRFARLFGIDDPARLDSFFTGRTVILRRNLDRKTAAEYYVKLRELGLHAKLVKVSAPEAANATTGAQGRAEKPKKSKKSKQIDKPEKAARREAALAKVRREAAARAAQKQAAREEQQRRVAAETARKNAEREQRQRIAAEQAAQAAERQRQRAQEAARLEAEAQQRKARASALRKAEHEKRAAERKALREQGKREAAQRAEHRRAERDRQRTIAAQQAAQRKAELAERKQQEAREAARRQRQERQRALEQAAQRAAERERRAAERQEQAAQRRAMEEQAINRGAQALGRQAALQPIAARVKTRLDTPRGAGRGRDQQVHGAPNLYSLQPFRNTPAVRRRAQRARRQLRRALAVAAIAGASLLLLAGAFLQRSTAPPDTGITALAIEPGSGPLLLVGDKLLRHDRSGLGAQTLTLSDMGVATLQAPLAFDAAGYLLAPGRLAAGNPAATASDTGARLLRCNLDERRCQPLPGEFDGLHIAGLTLHSLSGDLFVADSAAGEMVRIAIGGRRLGQASVAMVRKPTLQLAAGLLFTNSVSGPAISVFRYDTTAFGKQLDEILLLPDDMELGEHTRVRDFIRIDNDWWVILSSPGVGAEAPEEGVFRFDAQGKYLGRIAGQPHSRPRQLLNWAGKVLIRDAKGITVQRFSAAGTPEAPLRSDLLQHLHESERRAASLAALAWRAAFIALTLLVLGAAGACYVQRARSLVYKSHRERGAEPIDAIAASVRWLPPLADRQSRLRRTAAGYGLSAVVLLALGMAAGISSAQLLAILLALSGPAAALWLLYRSSPGHIGTAGGQVVLVDHHGLYHLGANARVLHRGPFLMIDDVVVFTGSRLLPAFPSRQLREQVTALAGGGIRVDRKTVAVRLLQSRHPLAVGAATTLAGVLLALLVLCFDVAL
ncbi:MAG: hypothetical protein KDI01_09660 [Halioglobus sp.]|nr:hypothetical protein [Halioglobus sp.]